MCRRFVVAVSILLLGSSAWAETIKVYDKHGGSVHRYDKRWARLAARGVNVQIVGPCQSACTVLLGHIPRSRICVTSNASFGFHLAKLQSATAILRRAYPPDIHTWINRHGGLRKNFIWLRAPAIYRYFKRC
jgi:hypothetical protein